MPMNLIVMGVEGVGKTTVGMKLAEALGFAFLDADGFHPPANIAKMTHGIPLTDEDRAPWLAAMHRELAKRSAQQQSTVLACSALKQSYRLVLGDGLDVDWIYLKASRETILHRIQARPNHFAKPELLDSQFETLEEPSDALIIDAEANADQIVRNIVAQLGLKSDSATSLKTSSAKPKA